MLSYVVGLLHVYIYVQGNDSGGLTLVRGMLGHHTGVCEWKTLIP